MQRHISKQTLDLGKAFVKINNAELLLRSVYNDLTEEYTLYRNINGWVNRLEWLKKDFKRVFVMLSGSEGWEIMQSQLLNDEDTLQVESINDMLLDMPKGMKDQIEKYIESLYNVYRLNNE